MKVLFVTSALGIDYESDCLFHGLVANGHEVTDTKYLWYLSKPLSEDAKAQLYGRGFTLGGTIANRIDINRENIADRIASHEFDVVIYGSINRCADFIDIVRDHYASGNIAIVDGEDDSYIRNHRRGERYFKRELTNAKVAIPISFAMPREKIQPTDSPKIKKMADIIPGKRDTYRFTDEQSYYDDYARSQYGITMRKAGWDCLRHYEILAAGALPYFDGMEACPRTIMTNWPWRMQIAANAMCAKHEGMVPEREYRPLLMEMTEYMRKNLTTSALADYVISNLG